MGQGWTDMMMGPFMKAFISNNRETGADEPVQTPLADDKDLRQVVDDIKQQLTALQKELGQR
jgi:hypothetical protein